MKVVPTWKKFEKRWRRKPTVVKGYWLCSQGRLGINFAFCSKRFLVQVSNRSSALLTEPSLCPAKPPQANFGVVSHIMPWAIHSTFLRVHYLLVILRLCIMYYKPVMEESLNNKQFRNTTSSRNSHHSFLTDSPAVATVPIWRQPGSTRFSSGYCSL